MKFESARLQNCPSLAKRIKYVASENVGAGYDILSFTKMANRNGFSDRLIEVKAVSPIDFRFYWSRNEIETARIHGKKYFLYLVPVAKTGFDIQKLKIIPNPFEAVYSRSNIRLRAAQLPEQLKISARRRIAFTVDDFLMFLKSDRPLLFVLHRRPSLSSKSGHGSGMESSRRLSGGSES